MGLFVLGEGVIRFWWKGCLFVCFRLGRLAVCFRLGGVVLGGRVFCLFEVGGGCLF